MTDPSSPSAPPARPALATALAVLCVLAIVAGVALFSYLRAADQDEREEQDRIAVLQATETFTETWNTFEPDEARAYIKRVSPLLTTKFRTKFTDAASDVVTGIEQQQLSSKGEVLVDADGIPLVGIAQIDPDSADVLVVADARRVASGQKVLRHWRWQVSLVKVDGTWLVDDFQEI